MTPAPWLHEFGMARLVDFWDSQESREEPAEVLCHSCNLYFNRHLGTCPSH